MLDRIDFQNGTSVVASRDYTYEPNRNLITSIENAFGSTTVSHYTYAHNEIGQRTRMGMNGNAFINPNHFAYKYDDLRQVTQAERFHGVDFQNPGNNWNDDRFAFAYDSIGNLITSSIGFQPITTTYTANSLNQYTAVGNKTPIHDADGNLTNKGDWEYIWNGENRLIEARKIHPVSAYEMRLTYAYDFQGRRYEKRVWEFNGSAWIPQQRHTFVWQGWNLIYEEIEDETTSTTSTRRFTWGLDLSGSAQGAGGVGGLLAVDDEGANVEGLYFYDANGNVGQVVDSSNGSILAHYEYSPFGKTITLTGSYADTNPFRFSTKYLDEELGWYYYGFRYYDPETGRWPNRDPIEERGALNLYGFVWNDGVNWWDVLGLSGNRKQLSYTLSLTLRKEDYNPMAAVVLTSADVVFESGIVSIPFGIGCNNGTPTISFNADNVKYQYAGLEGKSTGKGGPSHPRPERRNRAIDRAYENTETFAESRRLNIDVSAHIVETQKNGPLGEFGMGVGFVVSEPDVDTSLILKSAIGLGLSGVSKIASSEKPVG